jgi:hypothetical protein
MVARLAELQKFRPQPVSPQNSIQKPSLSIWQEIGILTVLEKAPALPIFGWIVLELVERDQRDHSLAGFLLVKEEQFL